MKESTERLIRVALLVFMLYALVSMTWTGWSLAKETIIAQLQLQQQLQLANQEIQRLRGQASAAPSSSK